MCVRVFLLKYTPVSLFRRQCPLVFCVVGAVVEPEPRGRRSYQSLCTDSKFGGSDTIKLTVGIL